MSRQTTSAGRLAAARAKAPRAGDDACAEAVHALAVTVVRRIPHDQGLTALATLSTLEHSGPTRVTDLASTEGISQPSMTSLVTNLDRAGYVERRRDPSDGRVTLVAVTTAGLDFLRDRRTRQRGEIAHLIGKLPDHEAAALKSAIPALDHLRQIDAEERYPSRDSAD